MGIVVNSQGCATIVVLLLASASATTAKYSGGTGEPNDPYQIATAEDLILLGESPDDYGKHFLLTADIDLDPNLLSGKAFDRAVIASDRDPAEEGRQGTRFTGIYDGNDRAISHRTINGREYPGASNYFEAGGCFAEKYLVGTTGVWMPLLMCWRQPALTHGKEV